MQHIGLHIIGLHGFGKTFACQGEIVLFQCQFYQLCIQIIECADVSDRPKEILTLSQIESGGICLIHQQEGLSQIHLAQVNLENHIGISVCKCQFFSEHFECTRIILAEVIGVSAVVEVNAFLVRHHLFILAGSHVVVIVAQFEIAQFHIYLCQSVVGREAFGFGNAQ